MSAYGDELKARQNRALAAMTAMSTARERDYVNPDPVWAESMALEMLLLAQCMKVEYQAAARNVIRYFCRESGLDSDALECEALTMASERNY